MLLDEVIVMPVCKRPEMLALALQAIDKSNHPDNVLIFADNSACIEDIKYVRDNYLPSALIFHAKPHIDVPSGMWNILHSLKAGYALGHEYIYLIEEDVLVHPDFFDWTRQTQKLYPNILASCGRRLPWLPNYNQYMNPGACFSKHSLSLVVPHITDELFADRRTYLENNFGKMDEISDLDDGLIRRIAKFNNLEVRYPDTAKCSHIGFMAYNKYRPWENAAEGIVNRIDFLKNMLKTMTVGRYTSDWEGLHSSVQL